RIRRRPEAWEAMGSPAGAVTSGHRRDYGESELGPRYQDESGEDDAQGTEGQAQPRETLAGVWLLPQAGGAQGARRGTAEYGGSGAGEDEGLAIFSEAARGAWVVPDYLLLAVEVLKYEDREGKDDEE